MLGPADFSQTIKTVDRAFTSYRRIMENFDVVAHSPDFAENGKARELAVLIEEVRQNAPGNGGIADFRAAYRNLLKLLKDGPSEGLESRIADWAKFAREGAILTRDLRNRIFLRNKLKDRDEVARRDAEHYLVKYMQGMSKEELLRHRAEARAQKYYNSTLRALEIMDGCTVVSAFPTRMTIEPISMCNFRCVMCPHGVYDLRPVYTELSDQQIEDLIPILKNLTGLAVQVVGEPTLSLQLGKIANFAAAHAVDIEMITNGSLLKKTNADLSQMGSITISFDGATADTFEAQRKGSNFNRIVENIRDLRASAPFVILGFNVCVTRLNIDELPAIARLATELGIDRIFLNPLNVREYPHLESMAVSREDSKQLAERVAEATKIAKAGGVLLLNTIYDRVLHPKPSCHTPRAAIIDGLQNIDAKNKAAGGFDQLIDKIMELRLLPPIPLSVPAQDETNKTSTPPGSLPQPATARRVALSQTNVGAAANSPGAYINRLLSEAKQRVGQEKFKIPYCAAPWVGGLIFATGEYSPCCYMGAIATTANQSMEALWNDTPLTSLREQMLDQEEMPKICEGCNGAQRYNGMLDQIELASRLGFAWEDIEWPRNHNPPPHFQQRFAEMRQRLFVPPTIMPVDTAISACTADSSPFLPHGFTAPTPAGRWSERYDCEIRFKVPEAQSGDDLLFSIDAKCLLKPGVITEQRVEVFIDEVWRATWTFASNNYETAFVELPASSRAESGNVTVRLEFPDSTTPRDLELNKQICTRAIVMRSFALLTVSPSKPVGEHSPSLTSAAASA